MTNIKVWYTLPRVDEYGRVHARNCYFEKNTEDIHWDERVLTVGKMKFYTRKYHIENGDLPNDVDDDYSYEGNDQDEAVRVYSALTEDIQRIEIGNLIMRRDGENCGRIWN